MALYEAIQGTHFDDLIGGTAVTPITKNVTLVAGKNYKRGSVLGKITASGKFTLVDKTASDGSQLADCVLTADFDATAADIVGTVYQAGQFNRSKLIVADGDIADNHEDELRDKNIYLTTIL